MNEWIMLGGVGAVLLTAVAGAGWIKALARGGRRRDDK